MTYTEKLRDPRWQKVRLKIMERDGWKCDSCGDTTRTLSVHHLIYIDGREPWDYPDSHLETLCDDCHEFREGWNDFFGRSLTPTFVCVEFCFGICKPLFDASFKRRNAKMVRSLLNYMTRTLAEPPIVKPTLGEELGGLD